MMTEREWDEQAWEILEGLDDAYMEWFLNHVSNIKEGIDVEEL